MTFPEGLSGRRTRNPTSEKRSSNEGYEISCGTYIVAQAKELGFGQQNAQSPVKLHFTFGGSATTEKHKPRAASKKR